LLSQASFRKQLLLLREPELAPVRNASFFSILLVAFITQAYLLLQLVKPPLEALILREALD
jgi:hypothetical protein